jgi:hypothetical protein
MDVGELDSFRKMLNEDFTSDNSRVGQLLCLSIINRSLMYKKLVHKGGQFEIMVSLTYILNHSPLVLQITNTFVKKAK